LIKSTSYIIYNIKHKTKLYKNKDTLLCQKPIRYPNLKTKTNSKDPTNDNVLLVSYKHTLLKDDRIDKEGEKVTHPLVD
jgi:hypothetical protein